jgi:hypothetical protein
MATAVIGGFFALGGVLLGVLLEPIKTMTASRARTRQTRSEQCSVLIKAAQQAKQGLMQLNAVDRARSAGDFSPSAEQVHMWIADINKAKDEMRSATALLRLYGPDRVADSAVEVLEADDRMFLLGKEPGSGEYGLEHVPMKLQSAADELDAAVQSFAVVARRHTR